MNNEFNIFMAIKPKYADLIYQKIKSLEWRKRISKKMIKHFKIHGSNQPLKVYIYESYPKKLITGYMIVDFVWKVNQSVINQFYMADSKSFGIELDDLYNYYGINRKTGKNDYLGYALNIRDAVRFDKSISLWDVDISYPPQDFIYLTPLDIEKIRKMVRVYA